MKSRFVRTGLAMFMFALGCNEADDPSDSAEDKGSAGEAVSQPQGAGKADDFGGVDSPDTSCQVVLRTASRINSGSGGYQTETIGDREWWVWSGKMDVAESQFSEGAVAHVLYSSTGADGKWYDVVASSVRGAPAGFKRFEFKFADHTVGPGMVSTSGMTNDVKIWLIPFIKTNKGRQFDHNAISDPGASYELSYKKNNFEFNQKTDVCSAETYLGDVDAKHCEIYVERARVAGGSHGLSQIHLYIKLALDRLAGAEEIREVGYLAKMTSPGGDCNGPECAYENKWHVYPATPFAGAKDYYELTLTIEHDFTPERTFEGVFFVKTKKAKFWVHAEGGGNFFIDKPMVENMTYILMDRIWDCSKPECSLVTVDKFPYLNPGKCR